MKGTAIGMSQNYEPLISVIVPIYNVERYLEKCINSILHQTYRNLEVILVDDGSPDNCGKICDRYSDKDPRIKVIHKQNGGLSDARNKGIDVAEGEYLAFVDSDDAIMPEMIDKLYQRIVIDQSDMAFCGYKQVDQKGNILSEVCLPDYLLSGFDTLKESYEKNGVLYTIACNKLIKRQLFQNIRFPVGKYNEDEFTLYRIIDQCKLISILRDPLYIYVQRDNSITQESYSAKRLDGIEASYERYCYFKRKGGKYKELLVPEGNTFTPIFFRSKQLFKPTTAEEKKRVREIDRMARAICVDSFHQWTLPRRIKLLFPELYIFLGKVKNSLVQND